MSHGTLWEANAQIFPAWSYGRARVSGGGFNDAGIWHQQTNNGQRGDHDIENELIFQSNQHFVFHDSRGFESGSVSELELMKKFIADRATKKQLAQRVHAIWWDYITESHQAAKSYDPGFAFQWMNLTGQLWHQKRSSSMSAILNMVRVSIVMCIRWFWIIVW